MIVPRIYNNERYWVLTLLLLTPLRMTTIVLTLPIVVYVYRNFKIRFTNSSFFFLILSIITTFFGLFVKTTYLPNVFDFWFRYMPILCLSMCISLPKCNFVPCKNFNLPTFVRIAEFVIIIIDLFGFLAFATKFTTMGEDVFGLPYGAHFRKVHGLAIINAIFFFYNYSLTEQRFTKQNLIKTIFFFISFIFCFYGLSLMILLISFIIYAIVCYIKKIKYILYICVFLYATAQIVDHFNPHFLFYIENNLTIDKNDDFENKRKFLFYKNTIDYYKNELPLSVIGTGPGGYSSRTTFNFNDESNYQFTKLFGHTMPPKHYEYVYPLWNKFVASFDEGTDGTRNQPYSSLITILVELGIIPFILFMSCYIGKIHFYMKHINEHFLFRFLFIGNLYFLMSAATDWWFECSEYLFFLIFELLSINHLRLLSNNKIMIK